MVFSPRSILAQNRNSQQHFPWDGLALCGHWKTLHFSSAVMRLFQSRPLWKWEMELTLPACSQGQNLALKVSWTVCGAHVVPSLSCCKLKKSCSSSVSPPKVAHSHSLVLHYNRIKPQGKLSCCADGVKASPVTEQLGFQGCLFNWVTSFPLQNARLYCPVS